MNLLMYWLDDKLAMIISHIDGLLHSIFISLHNYLRQPGLKKGEGVFVTCYIFACMTSSRKFWFTIHLGLLLISYAVPFLFDWQLVVTAYGMVILQFAIFDRCLMNEGHGLHEDSDQTFYSNLIESAGYNCNRKLVKRIVRGYLYFLLSGVTLWWQVIMDQAPFIPLLTLLD